MKQFSLKFRQTFTQKNIYTNPVCIHFIMKAAGWAAISAHSAGRQFRTEQRRRFELHSRSYVGKVTCLFPQMLGVT